MCCRVSGPDSIVPNCLWRNLVLVHTLLLWGLHEVAFAPKTMKLASSMVPFGGFSALPTAVGSQDRRVRLKKTRLPNLAQRHPQKTKFATRCSCAGVFLVQHRQCCPQPFQAEPHSWASPSWEPTQCCLQPFPAEPHSWASPPSLEPAQCCLQPFPA